MKLRLIIALAFLTAGTSAFAAPVRSLFHYTRSDSSAITQIDVDAAPVQTTPVSQDIFGNLIEHLGDLIDHTLWADPLINPNLERTNRFQSEAPYWDQAGAVTWVQNGNGYESPSYVRLFAPDGVLSQQTYLPVQRILRYTLTLYTRGHGSVDIGIHATNQLTSPMVIQTVLPVASSAWQKQILHWVLPAGAIPVGQQIRFAVMHHSGGHVDVDWIELFPDDAIHHMDPDVIKFAKAWHIPILRMAGNFSMGYNWRDGIGPRHARPTRPNLAWGGPMSNQFGTDQYLQFCRLIGAAPQIAVNAGNGTPREAAAWVHYCNAERMRVQVWEVGNEMYGPWEIGHTDSAGGAARFVQFRDAMLAADPNIKLIANGQGNEFTSKGLAHDRAWNKAVLKAAAAAGGKAPDWLSIHPLLTLPDAAGNAPYAQEWQSVMAHPWFMDQTLIPQIKQQIRSVEGLHPKTRIASTEWGLIISGKGWFNQPNEMTVAGAIYDALALNAYLRNSDWVTLSNMSALMYGGCIEKHHGVVYVDPNYYTNQLYSLAAPRFPVQVNWSGPGQDVAQLSQMPAASDVPDVDVYSALTADRNHLVLFAVNRRLNSPRPIDIHIKSFAVAKMSAIALTSRHSRAMNQWNNPHHVAPQPFTTMTGSQSAGWTAILPPHSLVVFRFQGKG